MSHVIGTVPYEAIPGLVFVRVPNEKGRWVLTDKCVAMVGCPYCKAVTGEPCRRVMHCPPRYKYHSGTHYLRRNLTRNVCKPKIRVSTTDLAEAQEVLPDEKGP